jgi:PQQ-dependent dehydrogenase (methanol/ethanol family)
MTRIRWLLAALATVVVLGAAGMLASTVRERSRAREAEGVHPPAAPASPQQAPAEQAPAVPVQAPVQGPPPVAPPVAGVGGPIGAGAPAAGQWTLPARDYANSRYSPLDQITPQNVGALRVIGTFATGTDNGHEGQPLVVGSTMYVITPFPNYLYALDLTKPGYPLKWKYAPTVDPRSYGIACCDVVNRGASYADGKIVYNTLDAHTVAVDAATGREVWKTQVGDIALGETMTMAPLVVGNKVYVGNSGGELGVRGNLAALDLGTGRILWRAWSTGPDTDVRIGPDFKPFYAKERGKDLGVTTWANDQWKIGGGTVWGWISYDPALNLIYYATANPGVWNPDMRPGDNKWSATIFARDAETGYARWAFQAVPHDAWDYDMIMENVLVDLPVQGKMRKLLLHPGRTGFVYLMDRETGELLDASVYQPTNWAVGYDLKTGQPLEDPTKRSKQGVVTKNICPSSTGAKDQQPTSFSPRTRLLYIPAHNVCMDYEGVEANYIAGTPYVGASVKMYPGPGADSTGRGELVAWDPLKARKVWGVKEAFPLWSGILTTGSDLLFYGTMDGWFKAVDARSGALLWQQKVSSGIVGNPITYLGPDGRQYVAVYAGIGGWMGAVAFPEISISDPYAALGVVGALPDIKAATARGGTLYVFGL